ncbi:hypothetical protein JXB27_02145 [Candidatus Woesearchaeota archaeon]|nr:hypothetical protein [Candidatus Woesearchaeota archaeon]
MKKKQNQNNSAVRNVIFLVALAIFVVCLTRIVYFVNEEMSIYYMREFNATFKVSRTAGLAADSDTLNFGMVPPGGTSRREIILYHEYKEPLKVKIYYSGSIRHVLSPAESFYINPGEEVKIGIIAYGIGEVNTEYSGKIKVLYLKQ